MEVKRIVSDNVCGLSEDVLFVIKYKNLCIIFEYCCLKRKEVIEILVCKVVEWFSIYDMLLNVDV